MTPSEINKMSWYEFEMFLSTLKSALEEEAERNKQQEKKQSKPGNSFMSMASQMKNWVSGKR